MSQHGLSSSISVTVTTLSCPHLMTNARISTTKTHIGTSVQLDCPTGSVLNGDQTLVCRDDGTWSSTPVPTCQLVTCPPLEVVSPHMRLLSLNNSYLGTAIFSCPLGYTLSPDVRSIWCDHTGHWSDSVPSCQLVTCPPPEPPEHGSLVVSGKVAQGIIWNVSEQRGLPIRCEGWRRHS